MLFFLSGWSLMSQDKIPIIWGDEDESIRGFEVMSIFGQGDSAIYVLRFNKRKKYPYALQQLSADSAKTLTTHIFNTPQVHGEDLQVLSPIMLKGKPYLFAATAPAKTDSIYLFALAINPEHLTTSQPFKITSVSRKALESEKEIVFYPNEDNSAYMLIIPRESDLSKNEKYELMLFSDSMKQMESRVIEIPYPADIIEYNDAIPDAAGNAFILASRENPDLTSLHKNRNIGRDFSLFIYNWEHGTLREKSLSLGAKWLYDVKLFMNKNSNIQVVGYYSNMLDLIMAGSFSLELNPSTGVVVHQGLSPFDRSFRTRFRPRSGSPTDTELGMFNLNYVFPKTKGNAQLISEKNYTETNSVFNPGTGTYSVITIYNYDEILISDIDPSSKINYNLVIPKFQSSTYRFDDYTSFLSIDHGDKTLIIYNDNDRNRSLPIQSDKGYRQLTSQSNSSAILIVIHEKGQTVKIPLYNASREHPVLNPNFFYRTTDGVILMGGSGYDIRFFKVKLK